MQTEKQRFYIAIDLKSFFASVECVERGLDPLTTNLVVADPDRTEKTICLAVTPSLKAHGIGGRARLFEVNQTMREVNRERRKHAPRCRFTGKSWNSIELEQQPQLEADFIIAPPHPRRLPGRKAPPVTTIPPFDFLIKELRGRRAEVTP